MLKNIQTIKPIEDARKRLLWLLIPIIIGFVVTFIYRDNVINFLLLPAHGRLSSASKPVFVNLTEPLDAVIKISFVGGLIVALPFIIYQMILFLSSVFRNRVSRRFLSLVVVSAVLLFATGVSFAYLIAFPALVHFTLIVGTDIAQPMIHISDYFSLMTTILLGAGVVFETPLVMYVLAKLKIVSYRVFIRFRRYLIVISFIIGSFFDPSPNPLDQIVIAVCLITLYEIGILLARMEQRPKRLRLA